jgi:hypothetical protein
MTAILKNKLTITAIKVLSTKFNNGILIICTSSFHNSYPIDYIVSEVLRKVKYFTKNLQIGMTFFLFYLCILTSLTEKC